MEYKDIKELMDIFNSSELSLLELKQNDFSLKLQKDANSREINSNNIEINKVKANVDRTIVQDEPIAVASDNLGIKSPLVGVFYQSEAPGKEPFVKIGQVIKKGDVVGIIEAMKMINEIKSPYDGKVVKIIAKDEQLVSFDETLMEIEV